MFFFFQIRSGMVIMILYDWKRIHVKLDYIYFVGVYIFQCQNVHVIMNRVGEYPECMVLSILIHMLILFGPLGTHPDCVHMNMEWH